MSTSEQCSSAFLDSSDLGHLHKDPDGALPTTCSICYKYLSWDMTVTGSEEPIQLACGHIFGTSCIQTWAMFNATCPICRAEFDLDLDDVDTANTWENEENGPPSHEYAGEYLDIHGDVSDSLRTTYLFEEDMWLALAHEEANPFNPSHKRRFSEYQESPTETARSAKRPKCADWVSPDTYHAYSLNSGDVSFDELTLSHEEWMTWTSDFDEPKDEFAVSYYDILV